MIAQNNQQRSNADTSDPIPAVADLGNVAMLVIRTIDRMKVMTDYGGVVKIATSEVNIVVTTLIVCLNKT